MYEMRTMHLFAGIGGGLLADLILGHKPIIAVEWEPYACQVLRERAADGWFPDLSVWEGDVRLFDPSDYAERVDCIHAGFPCQDISNAGKQAGLGEGTRSGLYREVLRIAGVVRPKVIFLENVSAILSNGLGTVLGDLAAMGYDAQWCCIKASDVGANHQRDRWFLLGHAQHTGLDATEIARSIAQRSNGKQERQKSTGEPTRPSEQYAELAYSNDSRRIHGQTEIKPAEGRFDALSESRSSGEDVAYSASIGQSRQREHVGQINPTQDRDRETDRIIDSSKDGKGWWQSEPNVGRVVAGDSARIHRLKGLGNMQVPLQAATAFTLLYERIAA